MVKIDRLEQQPDGHLAFTHAEIRRRDRRREGLLDAGGQVDPGDRLEFGRIQLAGLGLGNAERL